MIDTTQETPISLTEAAAELPRRRRGRKTHVSTLFRWTTAGCRGVILEFIQVGGTRCTSREALQRFFERLTHSRHAEATAVRPGPIVGGRTFAQRQRQSAAAGERLEALGA
jgi:hypothetical protein